MTPPSETGTDLVSAYLDDELEGQDVAAFEDLLESSPEVQEELEDLRKVISLVGGLGKVEAPEDFYEKLNRRIRRRQLLQPQTSSKLAMIAVPFQVLSILVILTVAALYMMSELDAAPKSIEREVLVPIGNTGAPSDAPRPVQP
ncbi:MAG: hypothetical protein AAGA54_19180 [Myxococcota bacterium]